jgi:hypothetical protein
MKRRFWLAIPLLAMAVILYLGFTASAQAGTLSVTLSKATPSLYTDVTSGDGPWSFMVTVTGRVDYLQIHIKNNPGPGDICFHYAVSKPRSRTFSFQTPPIPEAKVNACGSQYPDTNGEPLSLFTYIKTPDANAQVVISVMYPDDVPEDLEALTGAPFQEGTLARVADSAVDVWVERPVLDMI